MPRAIPCESLSDIPVGNLNPGHTYLLPESITREEIENLRLHIKATPQGSAIEHGLSTGRRIGRLPGWRVCLYRLTPAQIAHRKDVAENKGGRPVGSIVTKLAALEPGQAATIDSGTRHPQTIRNLASRAGKRLDRKFSVELLEGSTYTVRRVA